MKHSRDYIAGLLDKFVDGLTTEAEEQNLAEYFDTADEIPTEWESYKEMFMSFKTDGYDFSEEEVEAWIAPEAAPMPATPKHSVNMWSWAAAVASAAAVVAFVAIHSWTSANETPVASENVVKKVDNIIASVTFPDEQVERYEIRKVGEANIVTKYFDDGTSASFIVSCTDGESGYLLIALNENNLHL